VGKRIHNLEKVGRLSELDRMVFPAEPSNLPEKELLVNLEKRLINRAVFSIISIVECFSRPPKFLTLLVRGYEYADLKSALVSFLEKEEKAPAHTDIGRFQTVHFDAWPDIPAMLEGTEFDFLLDDKKALKKELGTMSLQIALDRHYYESLWKSLLSLSARDRFAAERILSDEISLRNSAWALRLRSYYGQTPDQVRTELINIPVKRKTPRTSGGKSTTLADEALQCLEFPLDNFSSWASWRWKEFLNSQSGEKHWKVDPRYFQNAASRRLYHLARHYFRLHPFSMDTIFCFIKMKQFEEDILTSSVEGLGMGMSGKDVISILGVDL
jgi:vacuolar-type H+-ATPase subunit C/Vma6